MSFEEWMRRVDRVMLAVTGLTHRDIADWNYRDAYDDDVSPRTAALKALANSL
ncbi:hypothetical protein SEA_KALNOKY_88 [Mycobacterium phage Kalnoky]|uniref:Uncharacterized protein n=1 Tax=Mycobacterium phage PurpleHaze TaxID=1983577 RepID=A0A220NRY7_9CAUD|nr:hypothetical protein KIJ57_gp11 [Mycobacterium phage Purple Haze]AVJ50829.1 hypothetical protein SEA_OLANP_86 [Mycobacterium phage OlanP]AXC35185.1 hypothetical protein SEA_PHRANNY_80 [Mycobacterium phage Phranny]AXH44134.1 hypothetical protein SEA_KALNOKY_88 [Mycobacterium phage Kalnoky]AXH44542.1 hypothetical protein SEA_MARIUS_88 [Mycobacterium phage Marius]AXH44712.1 hypothetical protein SEA_PHISHRPHRIENDS_84 [Mycobacterium phage PhishRPhriends]AXH44859.1 hypothetical protein SEA_REBA_